MQDLTTMLSSLKRPNLLVRAARHGIADYKRTPHLARILGGQAPTSSGAILIQLMDRESTLNAQRKERDAAYSPRRHTEVLIALLSEAQMFLSAKPSASKRGALRSV